MASVPQNLPSPGTSRRGEGFPFVASPPFLWDLLLPLTPRSNTRWKKGRGRIYVNPEHTNYETEVQWILKAAGVRPVVGKVGLWIEWQHYNKSRDIDSPLKTLLDAMQGIAYINDNQIDELFVRRSKGDSGMRVRLWVIP